MAASAATSSAGPVAPPAGAVVVLSAVVVLLAGALSEVLLDEELASLLVQAAAPIKSPTSTNADLRFSNISDSPRPRTRFTRSSQTVLPLLRSISSPWRTPRLLWRVHRQAFDDADEVSGRELWLADLHVGDADQ